MWGWPHLAALRMARLPQFGGVYQALADVRYNITVQAYRDYEAAHGAHSLDITEVMRGRIENGLAIEGKLFVLIETLESRYGPDFMHRYYRLKRHYGTEQPADTELQIHWLSLAAGEALFDFFATEGTTLERRILTRPVVYSTVPATTDLNTWRPLKTSPNLVPGAPVEVVFNTDMDESTINAQTVLMVRNNRSVGFKSALIDSRRLTLTPDVPFSPGDAVTVLLKPDIRDRRGNPLDGNGNGVDEGANDGYGISFAVASGS
jgi:hypothetical protein